MTLSRLLSIVEVGTLNQPSLEILLKHAARSTHPNIRAAAARLTKDSELLDLLADDKESQALQNVIENPHTSISTLKKIAAYKLPEAGSTPFATQNTEEEAVILLGICRRQVKAGRYAGDTNLEGTPAFARALAQLVPYSHLSSLYRHSAPSIRPVVKEVIANRMRGHHVSAYDIPGKGLQPNSTLALIMACATAGLGPETHPKDGVAESEILSWWVNPEPVADKPSAGLNQLAFVLACQASGGHLEALMQSSFHGYMSRLAQNPNVPIETRLEWLNTGKVRAEDVTVSLTLSEENGDMTDLATIEALAKGFSRLRTLQEASTHRMGKSRSPSLLSKFPAAARVLINRHPNIIEILATSDDTNLASAALQDENCSLETALKAKAGIATANFHDPEGMLSFMLTRLDSRGWETYMRLEGEFEGTLTELLVVCSSLSK